MYHESVFSLRQGNTALSKRPAISRVTLGHHIPVNARPFWHPLKLLDWSRISKDEVAIDKLPTRQKGYGFVFGSHLCSVDPIEVGAEFHEDSLGDRSEYDRSTFYVHFIPLDIIIYQNHVDIKISRILQTSLRTRLLPCFVASMGCSDSVLVDLGSTLVDPQLVSSDQIRSYPYALSLHRSHTCCHSHRERNRAVSGPLEREPYI